MLRLLNCNGHQPKSEGPNLVAMASTLLAMASNLVAMASRGGLQPNSDGLHSTSSNLTAMASKLRAMASNLHWQTLNSGHPQEVVLFGRTVSGHQHLRSSWPPFDGEEKPNRSGRSEAARKRSKHRAGILVSFQSLLPPSYLIK